jgi:Cache 3/Cache 2 fusion domain
LGKPGRLDDRQITSSGEKWRKPVPREAIQVFRVPQQIAIVSYRFLVTCWFSVEHGRKTSVDYGLGHKSSLEQRGGSLMYLKNAIVCVLAAGCVAATSMLLPTVGHAQQDKVKTAMGLLMTKTAKLGEPKLEGTDAVGGKSVPGLYFGSTKMNNHFDVVDEVVKEAGGTATLFVKAGDEYVRVATNVKKDDGSRAIGTVLDPKGKAIESIKKNEPYYGEADILGKAYITGYEPIHDAGKNVIGIYYVGYMKN